MFKRVLAACLVIVFVTLSFPLQILADDGVTMEDIIAKGKEYGQTIVFETAGTFYYHPTLSVYGNSEYEYIGYRATYNGLDFGYTFFKDGRLVTNAEDITGLTIMAVAANMETSDSFTATLTIAKNWAKIFDRNAFTTIVSDSIEFLSEAAGRLTSIYFSGGTATLSQIVNAVADATVDEIMDQLMDIEGTLSKIQLGVMNELSNSLKIKLGEHEAKELHNVHTYSGAKTYIGHMTELERLARASDVIGSQVIPYDENSTFISRFFSVFANCVVKFGSGFVGETLSSLTKEDVLKFINKEDESLAVLIKYTKEINDIAKNTDKLGYIMKWADCKTVMQQYCEPLYLTAAAYSGEGYTSFMELENSLALANANLFNSMCGGSTSDSVGTSGSVGTDNSSGNTSIGNRPANYVVGDYKITASEGLRLRTAPSTSADCPTGIPYGTTVTVSQINDRWGHTTYNGFDGWIHLDYTAYIGKSGSMTMQLGPWEYSATPTRALTQGMTGADVKWLQSALNIVMGAGLDLDSSFGPATYTAVTNFQAANGLAVDGSFGPASLSAMIGCLNNKGYAATAEVGGGVAGPGEVHRTAYSGNYSYYEFANYSIKIGNMTFPTAEYPNGSYFTTTGAACVGHNACKHFYNSGIDIGSQCMGFARYMFYQLFGTIDYDGNPLVKTYYESGSTLTVDYLKQILNMSTGKVKPGSHIRTQTGISGNQHSLFYLGCDDTYVYTYECNYRGNCGVSVLKYTWEDFKNYLTKEKQGIHYIQVPVNPLPFTVISTTVPEEVEKENATGEYKYYDYADYSIKIGDTIFPTTEFPNGSYFTNSGTACVNHNACRYFVLDGTTIGTQSLGFARYIYYKLFGTVDYDGNPEVVTYHEEDSVITVEYLKEIFNMNTGKVKPGSHLRSLATNLAFEDGHSMIYLGCDDVYVYMYEANFSGNCEVSVMKYTWENFKNYLTLDGMSGINYINVPANPLPYTVLSVQTCTATFDANGGSVDTTEKILHVNELYGALPIPERVGYIFGGWYTEENGGTQVNADTVVTDTASHTLYAYWLAIPVSEINLSKSSLVLDRKESTTITATVSPENATDKTVAWYSADPAIATVENGVITAVSEGIVNIYATANDGTVRACCAVTVSHEHVYVDGYCSGCGELEIIGSGNIGSSAVTWSLDGTGLLRISGSGSMVDVAESSRPWAEHIERINSIIVEEGVTGLSQYAFAYCTKLTSVQLPSSLTVIANAAFEGCTALESITIPSGVTHINLQAFWRCISLKDVTIPNSVKFIGNSTFRETALTEVVLPSSLETIDRYAFAFCPSLTSVTVPESVTTVAGYAFTGNPVMKDVIIYSKTAAFDENAFGEVNKDLLTVHCYKNSTVEMLAKANGITVECLDCAGEHTYVDGYCNVCGKLQIVASGTFYSGVVWSLDGTGHFVVSGTGAMDGYNAADKRPWAKYYEQIKSVVINDGVTSVSDYAFYYCTNLTDVYMADSIKKIGNTAFYNCDGLTSLDIPDGVTSVGSWAFVGCNNLVSMVLPEGVTEIRRNIFEGCNKLESVTFSDKITAIGEDAFTRCTSLTSFEIPETVTSVGKNAFAGCTALEKVIVKSKTIAFEADVFADTDIVLTCHKGSTADVYAQENSITVSYIPCAGEHTYVDGYCTACDSVQPVGDMDGDGTVSFADCLHIGKAILNGKNNDKADINGDGRVSLLDVLYMLKMLVK